MPQFDKHKINKYMEIVKYFGPGTSILVILAIMHQV